MKKKYLFAAAVLSALITAFPLSVYAEELSQVSLTFDGEELIEGDEIDNNFSVTAGEGVRIIDASYTNEGETWSAGQRPQIHLELATESGYEFKSKSSGYFKVEGMGAKFQRAVGNIKDDPNYLEVDVFLSAVKKKTVFELDPPYEYGWNEYTAEWEAVPDATSYELKLLFDGKTVTTVSTQALSYNFAGNMTKEGFYCFKIRALHLTKKGEWSSESEDIAVNPMDIDESQKKGGTPQSTGGQTSGAFSSYWKQDAQGVWRVYDRSGNLVTNCWLCDDAVAANGQNIWYLIDGAGNMISAGLVKDAAGNYYSLETEHNGHYGMMRYLSGTYGNITLSLEPSHNGRYGAINNQEAIQKLRSLYGETDISAISTRLVYTSSF